MKDATRLVVVSKSNRASEIQIASDRRHGKDSVLNLAQRKEVQQVIRKKQHSNTRDGRIRALQTGWETWELKRCDTVRVGQSLEREEKLKTKTIW